MKLLIQHLNNYGCEIDADIFEGDKGEALPDKAKEFIKLKLQGDEFAPGDTLRIGDWE